MRNLRQEEQEAKGNRWEMLQTFALPENSSLRRQDWAEVSEINITLYHGPPLAQRARRHQMGHCKAFWGCSSRAGQPPWRMSEDSIHCRESQPLSSIHCRTLETQSELFPREWWTSLILSISDLICLGYLGTGTFGNCVIFLICSQVWESLSSHTQPWGYCEPKSNGDCAVKTRVPFCCRESSYYWS